VQASYKSFVIIPISSIIIPISSLRLYVAWKHPNFRTMCKLCLDL